MARRSQTLIYGEKKVAAVVAAAAAVVVVAAAAREDLEIVEILQKVVLAAGYMSDIPARVGLGHAEVTGRQQQEEKASEGPDNWTSVCFYEYISK
jgi:hypothetical protein